MQERKWVASGLIVVGLALIFGLESITGLSTDVSAFDRVERRIPGGAVMGFGLALLNLRPWTHKVAFVASAFAWLTVERSRALGWCLLRVGGKCWSSMVLGGCGGDRYRGGTGYRSAGHTLSVICLNCSLFGSY